MLASLRKQVVDVRNDDELIALLKLPQRAHGIRKRRPLTDRFRQRADFLGTGLEMEMTGEGPHYGLQHIAVMLVGAALRPRFEFAIEFEDVGVSQPLPLAV